MTGEFDPQQAFREDADKAAQLLAELEATGGSADDIMLARMDFEAKQSILNNSEPGERTQYSTPPPIQSSQPLNITPGQTVNETSEPVARQQQTVNIKYDVGARAIPPSHQLAADAAMVIWSRSEILIDNQEIPLANSKEPATDYRSLCRQFMDGEIDFVNPPTNNLERKLARKAIQELTDTEIADRPADWNERFFNLQAVLNRV